MKRVRCLILDMGGVLTEDQREDKVRLMMGILGTGDREGFCSAYWRHRLDYDRGSADAGAYWLGIAAELGLALAEGAVDSLVRADLESWFNMRPRMLEFLGKARGRVGRLVLLSNMNRDGARFVRSAENRPWMSRFDALILSCEHGLLKPESGMYRLAIETAGVAPEDSLFVDDSSDNVEGARRAGMSSFRFTGEEDFARAMERDYELIAWDGAR